MPCTKSESPMAPSAHQPALFFIQDLELSVGGFTSGGADDSIFW